MDDENDFLETVEFRKSLSLLPDEEGTNVNRLSTDEYRRQMEDVMSDLNLWVPCSPIRRTNIEAN